MMRVEIEQLRAVAREYRRQRDELGAALATAAGAMAEAIDAMRAALANHERIRGHEGCR